MRCPVASLSGRSSQLACWGDPGALSPALVLSGTCSQALGPMSKVDAQRSAATVCRQCIAASH